MNRLILIITIFIFTAALSSAQSTQKGYVKTKGRIGQNGQLIPGTRLSGASIILLNGHSTVSDANGNFSLTILTIHAIAFLGQLVIRMYLH